MRTVIKNQIKFLQISYECDFKKKAAKKNTNLSSADDFRGISDTLGGTVFVKLKTFPWIESLGSCLMT